VQLGATVDHDDCTSEPTVTWSTSSAGFATVSNTGLVTGVGAGEVTITATAGGKSGSATFDVAIVPVAAVRITPDSIVIGLGAAATLTAEALDAQDNVLAGREISWVALNPGNADISASGQLTGVAVGTTAEVTATSEGQTATARVHVVRDRLAYFWSDVATPVGMVVPDLDYSFNSSGGALSIQSSGLGLYSAIFAGMGGANFETEALFISGYSAPLGGFCRIQEWGSTSAALDCHAADGTLSDQRFTVAMVGSASFTGRSGYAWVQSGTLPVDADHYYRYNPTGGNITSTPTGTGVYTVRFEGLGRVAASDREAVMVTSYGGIDAFTCQPASWTTVDAHLDVEVRCFDATGAATNSQFTILVVDGARQGARLAFAHADQPLNGAYAPTNSAVRPSGTAQVNRNSTGHYSIAFTGFYRTGDLRETVLISATGEAPGRCQVQEWAESTEIGNSTDVFVACATPDGVAADMPFSIVVLQ
jgi:hypothetical protein